MKPKRHDQARLITESMTQSPEIRPFIGQAPGIEILELLDV